MPKKASASQKQAKGSKPGTQDKAPLLLPTSASQQPVLDSMQSIFSSGVCEEGEIEAKRAANKSYITQNNQVFMTLAKLLKIKHFNVDVGSARRANRECQKFIMLNENGLFKMLEFDIAIFLFAIFQLCLTNLIVFKLNFKYMDTDLMVFSIVMLARRILCKTNHYYQVNIYRVTLTMFTVLRSVPLTIFVLLAWLLFKISVTHSVANIICLLLPSLMYCVVFGIPRGVLTISSRAFMAHPIYNPDKEFTDGLQSQAEKDGNAPKKDASQAKGGSQSQAKGKANADKSQRRKSGSAQNETGAAGQEESKGGNSDGSKDLASGKHLKMDSYYFEFSNMQRYSSATEELAHLIRTTIFNSFEIVYYTGFLPVKFIRPETQLYFENSMVLIGTITCLVMMLLLNAGHYLRKRAVEMQMNAKMSGQWIKIPKPNKTGAVPIQEWRPHISYPQGTIVSLNHDHHIRKIKVYNTLANGDPNLASVTEQRRVMLGGAQASPVHQGQNIMGSGNLSGGNQESSSQADASSDPLGSSSSNTSQVEYFMSVGALGNRSQPDDILAHLLYSLFNQPLMTMIKLRKFALIALLLQGFHIFIIRSRTMIPLQILNFMMCALFVHSQLIATEDFKRKAKNQKENAMRVDEWFKERTQSSSKPDDPQVNKEPIKTSKIDLTEDDPTSGISSSLEVTDKKVTQKNTELVVEEEKKQVEEQPAAAPKQAAQQMSSYL